MIGATAPDPMAAALEHFRAGRLREAEDLCRQLLEREPARADALHLLGVLAHQSGRREAAVELLGRAAALTRDNDEVHFNLGVAQQFAAQHAAAAASYRKSLRLQPERVEAHNNLGYTLLSLGQLDDALACFRAALDLRPDFALALANQGEALLRRGQLDAAATSLRRAIELAPDIVEAHNHLGVVLREQGNLTESESCFLQALRLRPEFAGAHNNLGRLCDDRGRPDEAAARFRLALCYQPNDATIHTNLANNLLTRGKALEALSHCRRAVELMPGEAVFHSNLAHALTLLGDPAEAEACCRTAIGLRPELADGHHNLAVTLAAQGRFAEALAVNAAALSLRPDYPGARNCRALWWLQAGDFERGWPEYEWRWRIRGVSRRPFTQPAWDGVPFPGRTVLIHAEQALGDTLQFIRYAPLVKERGGTVVVECQPPLVPLLRGSPGIDYLVARGSPLPGFDFQVPLLSLPGVFGTTAATVPVSVPYLLAEAERVDRWGSEITRLCGLGQMKIGVAWQGNPGFAGDRLRSIPLAQFAPLGRVAGVHLFALQKGHGREQLRDLVPPFTVTDLGDRLDADGAFLDTAAVLKCLDLLVTSDSAIAHLAGGLGVPVWVAVPLGADWRWLIDREASPWYPTMRLFRQRRLHDWGEVFGRMARELSRLCPAGQPAMTVPIAAGELIDKITILEIKTERLKDAAKLRNVHTELTALNDARDQHLPVLPELDELTAHLRAVNEALWRIEDDIRMCERTGDFGSRFIELARSVYRENDRRAALKRQISELSGSVIVEEKSYASDEPDSPGDRDRR